MKRMSIFSLTPIFSKVFTVLVSLLNVSLCLKAMFYFIEYCVCICLLCCLTLQCLCMAIVISCHIVLLDVLVLIWLIPTILLMIMTVLMTDDNTDDVDWCAVASDCVWLIDVFIYC